MLLRCGEEALDQGGEFRLMARVEMEGDVADGLGLECAGDGVEVTHGVFLTWGDEARTTEIVLDRNIGTNG